MSNNAGICADGSEIGRAQVLQALAAGLPPEARMNPVLLQAQLHRVADLIDESGWAKNLG